MIYVNSKKSDIKSINIFGLGEVYKQVEPLILRDNVKIEKKFDDFLGKTDYLDIDKIKNKNLLYCVGYKDMRKRYDKYKEFRNLGFNIISLISNNSILSESSIVGNGTIINQGAIIDHFVEIGECIFINIGAMISHNTKINNNVFIAPGVNIAGYVNVGEGCFIGINSTIIDHVNIGQYSVIGAGSVVIENVPPYSVVVGNPAKVIKKLR